MPSESFFDGQSEQSEVKTRIVEKYFVAWANIILPHSQQIAYIDLYSGPGVYKDGSMSTPLLVLKNALSNPKICEKLVTHFNDADNSCAERLQLAINNLKGIEKLRHKPIVTSLDVNAAAKVYFSQQINTPSLSFLDPFGYKGLSVDIIKDVIKGWGCDCIFFFNFNRVNPGIPNPSVDAHMEALFGANRLNTLRRELPDLSPEMKEVRIVEELSQAIKEVGGKFVLPFRFRNDRGTRTMHYLIFVSKRFTGYDIMKEIMAKESSTLDQGVPSFSYSPADASMPFLFSFNQPLERLKQTLPDDFSGQELTVDELYTQHSVDKPYIRRNYKDILLQLEEEHKIEVHSPTGKRRKGTLADHLMVRFPLRSGSGQ